ncbi:MAG: hypothetical protein AAF378_12460 [Cyanobacteria bacterium P01_A01_bin.84]
MKSRLLILAASTALTISLPATALACQGKKEANLTQEQRTELQQVKANAQTEVESILTSDQRIQFQSALQDGQKMKSALNSLNLSSEQESQTDEIMQSYKQQKRTIFNQG